MLKKICTLFAVLWFVTFSFAEADGKVISIETDVSEIAVHQDLTYAQYWTWPENRLKMDLYLPTNQEKVPAVIFVPGGWWITTPKGVVTQMGCRLAEAGFAVASIEHRPIAEANYKEVIGDVKAAIRFLRAHADEWKIDKDRIAVMGASAGAYLSVMTGVTGGVEKFDFGDNLDQDSNVQAVVDIFGPTDLTRIAADYPEDKQRLYASPGSPASILVNGAAVYKGNRGGSILDTPETASDANPLTYIDESTPPFLIMHGNADTTISPSQSKLLYEALQEKGVYAEYYIVDGGEHRFTYFYQPKAFRIIVDFLNRVFR